MEDIKTTSIASTVPTRRRKSMPESAAMPVICGFYYHEEAKEVTVLITFVWIDL